MKFAFSLLFSFLVVSQSQGIESEELQSALSQKQWDQAIQSSLQILKKSPSNDFVRVQGAYALFQKNYAHAAFYLLSKIPPERWKSIPQGQDRLAEIVLLMQKKIPMNILPSRLESVDHKNMPTYMLDEIQFAKGREAYEQEKFTQAQSHLQAVSEKSLYYSQARYLLGSMSIRKKDYATAAIEFGKVFEPSVYEQSAELWNEISSQMTSHWGANVNVILGVHRLKETSQIAELSVLALARIAYAHRDFTGALRNYEKINKNSVLYARAQLESVWTYFAMNQHDQAQKIAANFSVKEEALEAVEAKVVRALTLADQKKTIESRDQIQQFLKIYQNSKEILRQFFASQDVTILPEFVKNELNIDRRLELLKAYRENVLLEIKNLKNEELNLFPTYAELASDLDPLHVQANNLIEQITMKKVKFVEKKLDDLLRQALLIRVETLLEDREKMRSDDQYIRNQKEHDAQLVKLLSEAVLGVQEIIDQQAGQSLKPDLRLEFRQCELLWELGKTLQMISLDDQNKELDSKGTAYKRQAVLRALKIASDENRGFEKHAQAMFFVGFAKSELGETADSVQYLSRYVQLYPQHLHVPNAYRMMADLKFEANDFKSALELYKKILSFSDSPIVGYAFYKIGWCGYNLKDFPRSLLALEKAYLWAQKGQGSQQWLSLQREARRDLLQLYAEFGDYKKAKSYFNQFVPESEVNVWLVDLAVELDRRGQYEKSIALYTSIIASDKSAEENLRYDVAILRNYFQLSDWQKAIKQSIHIIEAYRPRLNRSQLKNEDVTEAEKVIREMLLAQQFEYRKRPTPAVVQRVQTLGDSYFSVFRDWPEAQAPIYMQAHYYLSEKNAVLAAEYFLTHWQKFNKTLVEPVREESIRNLVSALSVVNEKEGFLGPQSDQLLFACEEYEKNYQQTAHIRKIKFIKASVLFRKAREKESLALWQSLFDESPQDEIGRLAFAQLRSAYYNKKDWEQVYRWATALSAKKEYSFYEKDLQIIREESYFLWAQNMQDDLASAAQFEKIANDSTMKKLRDKSLYNAFLKVQKIGQKSKALALADELEKGYPQYEGLNSISGLRAALLQEAGDYKKALPLLIQFVKTSNSKTDPLVLAQAHLNVGLIAEALNQRDLALESFKNTLRLAGASNPLAQTANLGITRLHKVKKEKKETPSAEWTKLMKGSENFRKLPFPTKKDLGEQIKGGLFSLESLSKKFFDFSAASTTSLEEAYEAYCHVPFLYEKAGLSLLSLAEKKGLKPDEKEELKLELNKIAEPLVSKAKELADSCIEKASAAEQSGPIYQTVIERWRWQDQPEFKIKNQNLISLLQSGQPWFDPSALTEKNEHEILEMHLKNDDSEETWHSLALLRWSQGEKGLAKLTLIDGLNRYQSSAKMLNALAVLEELPFGQKKNFYMQAHSAGSRAACASLALWHLQGIRLTLSKLFLRDCLQRKSFQNMKELRELSEEFVR